jgi:sporulation protein YlmC with PRC-barrel domain
MAISEQLLQRADLIGTQVITRDSGKKLGVINQLWVDIDQREVVVLGLRGTLFTGEQRYMYLSNVSQIGDVVLVDNDDMVQDIDVLSLSSLIENEVVTEAGELLGKVRGFKFDPNTGEISALVIGSFGLPWIPERFISTYELGISEIVSTGPDRLIVYEGSEQRLNQLTVGLMERLGIGAPPWEKDDEFFTPQTTATANQLGPGQRSPAYNPKLQRTPEAVEVEAENWAPEPVQRQQATSRPQPIAEEDNWGSQPAARQSNKPLELPQDNLEEDVWEDPYEAPQINLQQKQRVPEYQQELE